MTLPVIPFKLHTLLYYSSHVLIYLCSFACLSKKTRYEIPFILVFLLILVSATSYLPRRWPAKYFRRYESLRPCSGWVRVVSSRLATDDSLFRRTSYTQNCIMIINSRFHQSLPSSSLAPSLLLRFRSYLLQLSQLIC